MKKTVGYVIAVFLTVVNFALFYLSSGHLNVASMPFGDGKVMFIAWVFLCACVPVVAQLVNNNVNTNEGEVK